MPTELNEAHFKHVTEHFEKCGDWSKERNHFFEWMCAAEFHWFFVQGLDAIKSGFYVPGISSLLNGFEASLRVTISQVSTEGIAPPELSPYKVLSNNLIKQAYELGLPVSYLALPSESDFMEKLDSAKPNRIDVELVRLRNNICHGNILEFINTDLGPENSFFTPECMRELAEILLVVAYSWAQELGKFRRADGLLHHDNIKTPTQMDG